MREREREREERERRERRERERVSVVAVLEKGGPRLLVSGGQPANALRALVR
jgi:hypothetical protein